jgi:serine/threonine-protein kinase
MNRFPQRHGAGESGKTALAESQVYLKDTDAPLPQSVNFGTRYAYFKTIAKGGKSLIKSCKDLHLSRVICYKTLRPELADDPV